VRVTTRCVKAAAPNGAVGNNGFKKLLRASKHRLLQQNRHEPDLPAMQTNVRSWE
jgi:hypothetical protein